MRAQLSATDEDLTGLLGSEARLLDVAVAWFCNTATYVVTRGASTLCFKIQPASRDVGVTLQIGGETVFELEAREVADVRVHRDPRNRVVEIVVSEGVSVWIRVDPKIAVFETCERHT